MLELPILLIALGAAEKPVYRDPRQATPPQTSSDTSSETPSEAVSDEELRSRVGTYLGAIDRPVTADQWRSLGPRAVPILEEIATDPKAFPSRRAGALGGLSAIGGDRARALVVKAARSEDEPFAVRAAALHGASRLLDKAELVKQLKPVLEGARSSSTRAVAADVLARHAPRSACGAIRAQATREGKSRAKFDRALQRCGG